MENRNNLVHADGLSMYHDELRKGVIDPISRDINDMKDSIAQNKPIVISDDTPIGTIIWYSSLQTTQIDNDCWRRCNGESLLKSSYSDLYGVIQNAYGETSTHFNIPNLMVGNNGGLFIRSVGANGLGVGTFQEDEIKNHVHEVGNTYGWGTSGDIYKMPDLVSDGGIKFFGGKVTTSTGGDETRPKNMQLVPYIKIKSRGKDMVSIGQEIEEVKQRGGTDKLLTSLQRQFVEHDRLNNYFPDNNKFLNSLGNEGYQKLPGGLIMQWGVVGVNDMPATYDGFIHFPIEFPKWCFNITCSVRGYDDNWNATANAYPTTASMARVVVKNNVAGMYNAVYWFAVGM